MVTVYGLEVFFRENGSGLGSRFRVITLGMEPLVTEEILARQTPGAQAILRQLLARRAELEGEVAQCHARTAELQTKVEQLQRQAKGKRPQNSSLPPLTQHPRNRTSLPKRQSKRKRGGQLGHEKHERPLIPAD